MDVGCYCINFSRLLAGEEPSEIHASAHLHEHGVDDLLTATMKFPSGVLASFTCGMSVHADNTAYVCGDEGFIEIPIPWKPPPQDAIYIISHGTPPRMDNPGNKAPAPQAPPREVRKVNATIELYGLESDDFAASVLDGKPPMMGGEESIQNMEVLDEMRRQMGVRFR
jgi:predicted dehydrogenase